MKTAQEILESNCPSMNSLFLDDTGKAFRSRVIQAMEEFAHDQSKEAFKAGFVKGMLENNKPQSIGNADHLF